VRLRGHRVRAHRIIYHPAPSGFGPTGNYAPINAFIFTRDVATGTTLNVVTDRSQGGGSIVDGQVEVMVHRR
jgi:hypothetical protein